MRIMHIFLSLLCCIMLSCSKKSSPKVEITKEISTTEKSKDFIKERYVKAIITDLSALDGCQFLLKLEDGSKLIPLNLEDNFKVDNLNVWVKYTENKMAVTICMAGKVVNILDIAKRVADE